jgi:hypothetical protein
MRNLFVWLVADGWCWFVLREKYWWLVVGGWFGLRESWWLISQASRAAAWEGVVRQARQR